MKYDAMVKDKETVRNYEGATAYVMTPEMELYTAVVTASLSDTYYESTDARLKRISELVGQVAPEFVARLAVYTRTEMHLRSIPLLLLVELAAIHNGDDLVARAVEKSVLRADEIMELLTCYQLRAPLVLGNSAQGPEARQPGKARMGIKRLNRLSHQLQNGLKRAFNRFDEYQFAKYDRSSLEVKLRDALFLVHPKAKDEAQQQLFDKIANRQLKTPYTWETELSALGQQPFATPEERREAFCRKWEELVLSGRMGYMVLMRNLRNMLQMGVSPSVIEHVAARLADEEEVKQSKQLPFRYLSAYRELSQPSSDGAGTPAPSGGGVVERLLSALETAVRHSAKNIEGFDEGTRVLVAADVSGSMWRPISPRSTVNYYDIGLLMAMIMRSRCKQVVTGIFGDEWKVVDMPGDNILMATQQLKTLANTVGLSTNGYKVVEWLIENRVVVDKVMMFTDMQLWDSTEEGKEFQRSWRHYRQMAPEAVLYIFDLAGYGQSPLRIAEPGVCLVAGWSDRVFSVLAAIERGSDAIAVINSVVL